MNGVISLLLAVCWTHSPVTDTKYYRRVIMSNWSTTDPREVFQKRATIVVIVEDDSVHVASVECKHGYHVGFVKPDHTSPDYVRRTVDESSSWPGWLWIQAPKGMR